MITLRRQITMNLKNKIAVITGGGRGLGRALAETLAQEGAHVVICSRSLEELKETCAKIQSSGGSCDYQKIDVTKESQIKNFIDTTIKNFAKIDILINNAGFAHSPKHIEKITSKEYQRSIKTNIDSIFYFLKAALPKIKKQKTGTIITISSAAGKRGHPRFSVYSASKFAGLGLTQAVAKELETFDIKCIAICPGGINTEMRRKAFGQEDSRKQQSPEIVANIIKDIILGKITAPNGSDIEIRDGRITAIRHHQS